MSHLMFLVPVILAVLVHEGESVRCWTCTSDLNPACGDPFYPARQDSYNLFNMVNCDSTSSASYPSFSASKTACKKQKKYVNGEMVISRGCTWKRSDDYSSYCPSSSNGPNEVTAFCETCEYDGCNGAAAIGKTIALLAAPLALLLFK